MSYSTLGVLLSKDEIQTLQELSSAAALAFNDLAYRVKKDLEALSIPANQANAALGILNEKHWSSLFNAPNAVLITPNNADVDDDVLTRCRQLFLGAFTNMVLANKTLSKRAAVAISALQKVVFSDMNAPDAESSKYKEQIANARLVSKLSETINDSMLSLVDLTHASRKIHGQIQLVAAAMEEMSASVGEISHSSSETTQDAQNLASAATSSISGVEAAVRHMSAVASVTSSTAESVANLQQASDKIGEILVSISAIAKQTNLLALNATIEAARAGESGKGFAVVAGEVKALANQTQKATEDIRLRTDILRKGMSGIIESIDNSRIAVNDGTDAINEASSSIMAISNSISIVADRTSALSDILGQQKEATQEINQGIDRIVNQVNHSDDLTSATLKDVSQTANEANKMILEDLTASYENNKSSFFMVEIAKVDHIVFCKRVTDIVAGTLPIPKEPLADHHNCRFGKWYDAQKDPALLGKPAWRAIVSPHEKVHHYGRQAIDALRKGDDDLALECLHKLHLESRNTLEALQKLSV